MNSEMVERVARALYDSDESDFPRFGWEHDRHLHSRYRYFAQAAIEAMREPVSDTVETAIDPEGVDRWHISPGSAQRWGWPF